MGGTVVDGHSWVQQVVAVKAYAVMADVCCGQLCLHLCRCCTLRADGGA
jgi:hypothetical protein